MSCIIVDIKVNKGSPSVKDDNGRMTTVKCVVHFYEAFFKQRVIEGDESAEPHAILDTAMELSLAIMTIAEARAYAKLYPQILP